MKSLLFAILILTGVFATSLQSAKADDPQPIEPIQSCTTYRYSALSCSFLLANQSAICTATGPHLPLWCATYSLYCQGDDGLTFINLECY